MNTKVKGDKIKENSIPFSALDKNINKDIPVVVGNLNEDLLNRFKYIVDNLTSGTVYGVMHFGDMCICGKINSTFSGRHQIMGVVIDSNTDKFKEGDGIRIGGGSGEFLTPLCGNYAEVTSCGLTYENTSRIDPVVWKYLCNPYILENGETIPVELISESNDAHFKYTNKGMYLIHVSSAKINEKDWYMNGEISTYIPVYSTESNGEALYGTFIFTGTDGEMYSASVNVYCNNGKVLINSYQN